MGPAELLAEALDLPMSLVEEVGQLDAGHGNRSVHLRVGLDGFVVRIGAGAEHLPGIDRFAECMAMNAVAPRGLGPDVIRCDPCTGLLITRYLDGQRWTAATFQEPSHLARLAKRLAELHRIPPPPNLRRLRLDAHVAMLERRVDGLSKRVRAIAASLLDRLGHPVARLCHNDVHAGNVVDAGDVRLLDWEYAASGDPDFDLAAPVCYHRIEAPARNVYLDAYEAAGRHIDRNRFAAVAWIFDYVTCLWELALPARPDPAVAPPVVSMQRPVQERLADLESIAKKGDKLLTAHPFYST